MSCSPDGLQIEMRADWWDYVTILQTSSVLTSMRDSDHITGRWAWQPVPGNPVLGQVKWCHAGAIKSGSPVLRTPKGLISFFVKACLNHVLEGCPGWQSECPVTDLTPCPGALAHSPHHPRITRAAGSPSSHGAGTHAGAYLKLPWDNHRVDFLEGCTLVSFLLSPNGSQS